jgi:hypothetical protein
MTQKYNSKDSNDGPIMPGIGCFAHRLYVENWLKLQALHKDEKHFARSLDRDPCILCEKRSSICKKLVVSFQ